MEIISLGVDVGDDIVVLLWLFILLLQLLDNLNPLTFAVCRLAIGYTCLTWTAYEAYDTIGLF